MLAASDRLQSISSVHS